MASVGGSSSELTLNGRPFGIAADADVGVKIQRFENDFQANGNLTSRQIKVASVQMLDGVSVSIDDSLDDLQYLKSINDSTDLTDVTVALPSGAIYAGRGNVTAEFKQQSQAATAELAIMFQGDITKQ